MLSRVAESLYWMARNCERTEHNAHILSTQLIKKLEASEQELFAGQDWQTMLDICTSAEEYFTCYDKFDFHCVVDYLTFSKENINSLANTIFFARENARVTRDIIPVELWEVWNEFYLETKNISNATSGFFKPIHEFLNQIKRTSFTATGIIDSAMVRELPYHFIKIGKWLERAEKTAIILTIMSRQSEKAETPFSDDYFWRSALEYVHGSEAFFRKYPPAASKKDVIQFLVSDVSFPRSLRYCMEHVWEAVKEIERGKVSHYSWQMYAQLDAMMTDFAEESLQQLEESDTTEFLLQSLAQCVEFGKTFSNTYYLIEREQNV